MSKRSVAITAIIAAILVISLFLFAYFFRGCGSRGPATTSSPSIKIPLSVHARVVTVVQTWDGSPNAPVDTDQLATLWGPHSAPYNPVGVQLLVNQLQSEFSTPPITAKCVTTSVLLTKVSNVGALASAVEGCI